MRKTFEYIYIITLSIATVIYLLQDGLDLFSNDNETNYVKYKKTLLWDGVHYSGKACDHPYVDLALPSGTKWAIYNVGADRPLSKGFMFAWAEKYGDKLVYDWSHYAYAQHDCPDWNGIYKYTIPDMCFDGKWYSRQKIFNGDGHSVLMNEDDAAKFFYGEEWCMPSPEQVSELINGCNWYYDEECNDNGILGFKGISKYNGLIIFFPISTLAVVHTDNKTEQKMNYIFEGSDTHYWTNSLAGVTSMAFSFKFSDSSVVLSQMSRCNAAFVRGVCEN